MDFELVAKLLLLLLIGMGPKIALVPFLEKTKTFDAETQRAVGRQMVVTAVVTALILFAFGALWRRRLPEIRKRRPATCCFALTRSPSQSPCSRQRPNWPASANR